MSSIAGEYTRIGRPGWLRRKFTSGRNTLDTDDIYGTHESFLTDLYELADDEGWAYTAESPEITVAVDDNEHTVSSWDDVEELQHLENTPIAPQSSEWNPEIDGDEPGPIQELRLKYERQSGKYGRQESIGVTVTVEDMDATTFDDLIDRMEDHYGDTTDWPYRYMPDPAI